MKLQFIDNFLTVGSSAAALVLADYLDELGEDFLANRLRFVFENEWSLDWSGIDVDWYLTVEPLARSLSTSLAVVAAAIFFLQIQSVYPIDYRPIADHFEGEEVEHHQHFQLRAARQILLRACGLNVPLPYDKIKQMNIHAGKKKNPAYNSVRSTWVAVSASTNAVRSLANDCAAASALSTFFAVTVRRKDTKQAMTSAGYSLFAAFKEKESDWNALTTHR